MPRRPKVPRTGALAYHHRQGHRLTPAQKESILRSYHLHGSYHRVAKIMGISDVTVKRVVLETQLDPAFAHVRAQAFDEMAGKVAAITDQVVESIQPGELVTTHHQVHDACGNLLRVVTEGPSLKDKALAIGILLDKQAVLQQAKSKAIEAGKGNQSGQGLLLPESVEEMRHLLAQKVKSLRIMDVQFDNSELGQQVKTTLKKVGITEDDVQGAEVFATEPFDY